MKPLKGTLVDDLSPGFQAYGTGHMWEGPLDLSLKSQGKFYVRGGRGTERLDYKLVKISFIHVSERT